MVRLKEHVVRELAEQGLHLNRKPEDRKGFPVDYRCLQLLLSAAEDPKVSLGDVAQGVRVGPGVRLPRQPALYPTKKKWSLKQPYGGADYLILVEDEEANWWKNFSSVEPWIERVLEVLEDQSSRGHVLKLAETEARGRFPDLVVASLGAIRKDKLGRVVTARVLFDDTNGIYVNCRTRVRDQERSPILADLKRLMREKSRRGRRTLALTADVAEVHRQVPIHPQDWLMLRCQVRPGDAVYVRAVGTFGVASASYYWSRVAGAIGRDMQYCAGSEADTWHVLIADWQEVASIAPHSSTYSLFVSSPGSLFLGQRPQGLTWRPGFVSSYSTAHTSSGFSQRRAEWFIMWTRTTAELKTVHLAKFEEGLGRIMYVTGVLEHERPFMAPLYKFMTIHPRHSVQAVASFVAFFLRFLAGQIEQRRHCACAVQTYPPSAVRVDAQASAERTDIGGWLPSVLPDGSLDSWSSRLPAEARKLSWVYEKSDKPSLFFSTFEAFSFSLVLLFDDVPSEPRTKVQVAPTWTDNRGNGSALHKLMTSRYPASGVLMEMSAPLLQRGLQSSVQGAPRTANREADRLANQRVHTGLQPAYECVIDPETIPWILLPRALAEGRQAERQDFQRRRRQRRRRQEERLRMMDSW